MIPLHNEIEKTCQFNQNTRALLRMHHFRDTVPLKTPTWEEQLWSNQDTSTCKPSTPMPKPH